MEAFTAVQWGQMSSDQDMSPRRNGKGMANEYCVLEGEDIVPRNNRMQCKNEMDDNKDIVHDIPWKSEIWCWFDETLNEVPFLVPLDERERARESSRS